MYFRPNQAFGLGLRLGPGEGLQIGVQAHQDKDGGGEHYPVHEPEAAGRNAHIFKGIFNQDSENENHINVLSLYLRIEFFSGFNENMPA